MSLVQFKQLLMDTAHQFGLDPGVVINQVRQESGFDPHAKSPVGAAGLFQLMPGTARQYGLRVDKTIDERLDPAKAAVAYGKMMSGLLQKYGGNYSHALAAYNGGDGAVKYFIRRGGVFYNPKAPADSWANQTGHYVQTIMGGSSSPTLIGGGGNDTIGKKPQSQPAPTTLPANLPPSIFGPDSWHPASTPSPAVTPPTISPELRTWLKQEHALASAPLPAPTLPPHSGAGSSALASLAALGALDTTPTTPVNQPQLNPVGNFVNSAINTGFAGAPNLPVQPGLSNTLGSFAGPLVGTGIAVGLAPETGFASLAIPASYLGAVGAGNTARQQVNEHGGITNPLAVATAGGTNALFGLLGPAGKGLSTLPRTLLNAGVLGSASGAQDALQQAVEQRSFNPSLDFNRIGNAAAMGAAGGAALGFFHKSPAELFSRNAQKRLDNVMTPPSVGGIDSVIQKPFGRSVPFGDNWKQPVNPQSPSAESIIQSIPDQQMFTEGSRPPLIIAEKPLPKTLEKSSPRMGSKKLTFASDVDKALYIVARREDAGSLSKADDRFLNYLQEVFPNLSTNDIIGMAQKVRDDYVVPAARAVKDEQVHVAPIFKDVADEMFGSRPPEIAAENAGIPEPVKPALGPRGYYDPATLNPPVTSTRPDGTFAGKGAARKAVKAVGIDPKSLEFYKVGPQNWLPHDPNPAPVASAPAPEPLPTPQPVNPKEPVPAPQEAPQNTSEAPTIPPVNSNASTGQPVASPEPIPISTLHQQNAPKGFKPVPLSALTTDHFADVGTGKLPPITVEGKSYAPNVGENVQTLAQVVGHNLENPDKPIDVTFEGLHAQRTSGSLSDVTAQQITPVRFLEGPHGLAVQGVNADGHLMQLYVNAFDRIKTGKGGEVVLAPQGILSDVKSLGEGSGKTHYQANFNRVRNEVSDRVAAKNAVKRLEEIAPNNAEVLRISAQFAKGKAADLEAIMADIKRLNASGKLKGILDDPAITQTVGKCRGKKK